jgi:hypothetical protein
MPPKNIGISDRRIRLIIGILLLLIGSVMFLINQILISGIILLLRFVPLFTSVTGRCPLYCATGKSTIKTKLF